MKHEELGTAEQRVIAGTRANGKQTVHDDVQNDRGARGGDGKQPDGDTKPDDDEQEQRAPDHTQRHVGDDRDDARESVGGARAGGAKRQREPERPQRMSHPKTKRDEHAGGCRGEDYAGTSSNRKTSQHGG